MPVDFYTTLPKPRRQWLARQNRLSAKAVARTNFTIWLIMLATFQLNARSIAQTITLSEKNAPLEKVFSAIEKQSGYYFVFNSVQVKQAKPVTIDIAHASLEQVLAICFKDQPFTYTIVDNLVVVKSKEKVHASIGEASVLSGNAVVDIKGRVTNENGDPIAGVTVTVKGSKQATSTNSDGYFSLANTDKNAVLIFSGANVETFTLNVSGQAELIVKLTSKINKLDAVQVIAYGTTTKRLNPGNTGTITAAEIAEQPVNNPILAMEGKVPGVFITQTNGIPGGGINIRIQGQNSILNGNDPLYVIDGVPYFSQNLTTFGASSAILGASGNTAGNSALIQQGNTLSYINPADIESIDVLKDADATAIYGSRAANGAILITTKKGKIGQTKIDINLQQGWGKVGHFLDLLNTKQYLEMRKEGKQNDNAAVTASDYDLNGLWDTTRYTDWQKVLIGGTARYSQYSSTVSGGNSNTQYLVGGTYHRETTVFPGNFSNQSGTIHFNINSASVNQRFHLQFSGSYMANKSNLPGVDLTQYIFLAPNAPSLYNSDETLNWAINPATSNSSWTNPLAQTFNLYNGTANSLLSNAILSYRILPGMEFKSSFGYTSLTSNDFQANLINSVKPENRPNYTRSAFFSFNTAKSWIIEPQLSYKRNWRIGKLDLLLGASAQEQNNNGTDLAVAGQPSDQLLMDPYSGTVFVVTRTDISTYKYNGGFGRFNYNWHDKYILDLTARKDGSSRFGDNSRFHNFSSIAGAWIFTQEAFCRNTSPFLSFGKLRGSYGTTGNDQIGNYNYLNLYNSITYGNPYQGAASISPNGLSNPYLQWEETHKLQLGIDLGFVKDKILLSAVYNQNRSSNEITSYSLPTVTGFSNISTNFPALVQNTSWEFTLSSENIHVGQFSWNGNFNLTIPTNKLVSFPNLAKSSYSSNYIIGQPISIVRNYAFFGVDPLAGTYLVTDQFGNPTALTNVATDRTVVYTTFPKFYGGFQSNLKYKGFHLNFLLQFVSQNNNNFYATNNVPGNFGAGLGNQPDAVLQRWQKPGDITNFARFSSSFVGTTGTRSLGDMSFVRLKNLSFSYQFAEAWLKRLHLQSLSLFVNAQNVFTLTKYKGFDPENLSTSTLPPLRVITTGINIEL